MKSITVAQLLGWAQIAQVAIPLGIATVQNITEWIKAAHGHELTDAEMNVVLSVVLDDATRRRALALADAVGG